MGSGEKKGREFVIGDIHGAFKALEQCLNRARFNPETDTLFSLGDLVDGWPESSKCIDYLLGIPNLNYIQGNHDVTALQWMESGIIPDGWERQGGKATINSYSGSVPDSHIKLIREAPKYLVDRDRLFVHGGIDPFFPFEEQDPNDFLWDRTLYYEAMREKEKNAERQLTSFREVFIGHTPVHREGYLEPFKACEVWMMDTGAGWNGVLSLMDLETYKVFTSEPVTDLYPGHSGRTG